MSPLEQILGSSTSLLAHITSGDLLPILLIVVLGSCLGGLFAMGVSCFGSRRH